MMRLGASNENTNMELSGSPAYLSAPNERSNRASIIEVPVSDSEHVGEWSEIFSGGYFSRRRYTTPRRYSDSTEMS